MVTSQQSMPTVPLQITGAGASLVSPTKSPTQPSQIEAAISASPNIRRRSSVCDARCTSAEMKVQALLD